MSQEDEMEFDGEEVTDEQLEELLQDFTSHASETEVGELFSSMNENNIIQWGEVEQIMSGRKQVVKSGLPQQMKPTEPDNTTDVDRCLEQLRNDDSDLTELNLNNMKRTPVVQIQKIFESLKTNTHLGKLSLANTGLTDTGAEPLMEAIEENKTLLSLNLETNYLSGKFITQLLQKLLKNQTLEELRISNQGVAYGTNDEMEMAEAIEQNENLLKLGLTFRKHEARHMVDAALYRNNEIRRLTRKREKMLNPPAKEEEPDVDEEDD